MKRWTPAWALLFVLSPSWAGDIRSLDAPAALPVDKPIVAPLDPSAAAVAPAAVSLAPVAAVDLEPAQLPQSAVTSALPAAAQASPASAQKSPEAASAQPAEANQWNGVFDGAHAAQPLALDVPAAAGDVDGLVASVRNRRFPGVFFQQEHEGNLVAADPRDSSGDVFRYYKPVSMRPDVVAEIKKGMTTGEKAGYALRFLSGRDDWKRFGLSAKLKYLDAYDRAVQKEKGKDAAWKGDTFLLLEKTKGAPDYLADHPVMEAPPEGYDHLPYARFLRPEIVTAKGAPARTINEAIGRAKSIIGDTAHAGVHFHVFMKLTPAELRSRLPSILSALQVANNAYYAQAASQSPLNLAHPYLTPWHEGRSRRVAELVARGSESPEVSAHGDADSEKFAFMAFRYWGMEDGRVVFSFELRGVGIPMVSDQKRSGAGRGIEGETPTFRRDYREAERRLAFAAVLADAVTRGALPSLGVAPVTLDAQSAERQLAARAKQRGMPEGSYLSLDEFSQALFGRPHNHAGPHPGLLLPFSPGAREPSAEAERVAFIDEFLDESARLKSLQRTPGAAEDQKRHMTYLFWSAYAQWAQRFARAQQSRLDRLFVSLQ